jgi:hypothetical protein
LYFGVVVAVLVAVVVVAEVELDVTVKVVKDIALMFSALSTARTASVCVPILRVVANEVFSRLFAQVLLLLILYSYLATPERVSVDPIKDQNCSPFTVLVAGCILEDRVVVPGAVGAVLSTRTFVKFDHVLVAPDTSTARACQ